MRLENISLNSLTQWIHENFLKLIREQFSLTLNQPRYERLMENFQNQVFVTFISILRCFGGKIKRKSKDYNPEIFTWILVKNYQA